MRIMVIGDSASGKSTFSLKLGELLGVDPWHLDIEMDRMGRSNRQQIKELIRKYIDDHKDWIIEGNAFTKDRTYRIETTDMIVVFSPMRHITFYRVVRRYLRQKMGIETRVGSSDVSLNLGYYVPYICWQFPRRRRAAENYARELGKTVIQVKNYRSADRLIEARFWESLNE
jgi:adenylate kinase family enzyme